MEPIVIIVKDIKNGKIMLTEDELKTIVRRAYNDGYWEGRKTNWYGGITYTTTTARSTDLPINYDNTSGTPYTDPNIKITCDTDRNSVFAPGGNITATNSIFPGDNTVEKITPCDAYNDL